MKIGFVGAGAMAQAIAEGLLNSGTLSPDNILASATSSRFRAWWEQRKIKFSEDNHSVIEVRTVRNQNTTSPFSVLTFQPRDNRNKCYRRQDTTELRLMFFIYSRRARLCS